jgi:hypothetical protein
MPSPLHHQVIDRPRLVTLCPCSLEQVASSAACFGKKIGDALTASSSLGVERPRMCLVADDLSCTQLKSPLRVGTAQRKMAPSRTPTPRRQAWFAGRQSTKPCSSLRARRWPHPRPESDLPSALCEPAHTRLSKTVLAQTGEIGGLVWGADLWHTHHQPRKAYRPATLEKTCPGANSSLQNGTGSDNVHLISRRSRVGANQNNGLRTRFTLKKASFYKEMQGLKAI